MNKAYERETEMRNQIFKEYTLVDLRNLNLQVETMSVVQGIQSNNKSVYKNLQGAVALTMNCSPSSRQLKKYKFFLPAEIYLLAVFMQLASKFHVFPLVLKFQDSFANVCCETMKKSL